MSDYVLHSIIKRTLGSNGYVRIKVPTHPYTDRYNWIAEERYAMESLLGRYLQKEEVIHHINKICDDNRPENLQLFSNVAAHISYHANHCDREPWLGKSLSAEHKENISRAKTGCTVLNLHHYGNSYRTGTTHTEETKRKMKEASRKRWDKVKAERCAL